MYNSKPSYLTEEAKTFLEWCVKYKFDKHNLNSIEELTDFYSQPFTKDMIVRPEKPNKKTNNLNAEIVVWEGWQSLFKGEWSIERKAFIFYKSEQSVNLRRMEEGTIDDFIREAKKAGINLEWND